MRLACKSEMPERGATLRRRAGSRQNRLPRWRRKSEDWTESELRLHLKLHLCFFLSRLVWNGRLACCRLADGVCRGSAEVGHPWEGVRLMLATQERRPSLIQLDTRHNVLHLNPIAVRRVRVRVRPAREFSIQTLLP